METAYVVLLVFATIAVLVQILVAQARCLRVTRARAQQPALSPETIDLVRRAYGVILDAGLTSSAFTRQRSIDGRLLTWTGGVYETRSALRDGYPPVPGLPGVRYTITNGEAVSFMFGSTFATLWPLVEIPSQKEVR